MHFKRHILTGMICLCVTGAMLFNVAIAQETTPEATPETTEEAETMEAMEATPEATAPAEEAQPPAEQFQTYIVRPGDTLFRIAVRFGTTTAALAELNGITNRSLIFSGQELRIPGEETELPPETPTTTYTVRPGDTLYRIAVRFGTTISVLSELNNLSNPSFIFYGQVLEIPSEEAAPEADADTPAVEAPQEDTTSAEAQQVEFTGDPGFAYGIEAFMLGQDVPNLINQMLQLDVSWVKVRVEWRDLEPTQGEIDFTELDNVVSALDNEGFSILLTVTNAPDWSRQRIDESQALNENAPPEDLATFETFIQALAERYAGQVDAYQIWDEPNLRRNWSCQTNVGSESDPRFVTTMCDTSYVEMLQLAYNAINAADADALVITAGLAPTGFNDGVNAIADRVFLQGMYNDNVTAISDAIAVHPGGWANPPDAECCEASPGVESHFENESFYFLETLQAYRDIMVQNGDAETPLWVTRFGWGTSEDTDAPSETNVFVTYTSLSEQAIFVPRGFAVGEELGYVGPMFVDNLNGCQGLTYRVEACYTALIAPDGSPRPVFNAVQMIDQDAMMPEATPEAESGN